MKNKKNMQAFTLVELIIVITILAILATIAFVSFQNYTHEARDTARVSTLRNIKTGLDTFYLKAGFYPESENATNIMANGQIISNQGYFGSIAARNIKMKSIPLDPFDQEKYIYATSQSKTKYELMGYLEGNNNLAFTDISYAKDFSFRYPKTFGDNIGIILDAKLVPISGASLDVSTTNNVYNVYFSSNETISGTGGVLKSMVGGGSLAYGLVGYWSFDEGSGLQTTANYTKSPIKTTSFQDSINYSFTGGKNGNGLYFTGASLTGISLELGTTNKDYKNGTSVSFWVKTFSGAYNGAGNAFLSIGNYWCHINANNGMDRTHIRFIPNTLHETNLNTLNDSINPFYSFLRKTVGNTSEVNNTYFDGNFHLHTVSFNDWGQFMYFIDDKKIYSNTDRISNFDQQFIFSGALDSYSLQKITDYTIVSGAISKGAEGSYPSYISGYKNGSYYNPKNLQIGKSGYGIIDEVRVYNRSLTEEEILSLYNATK